MTVEKTRDTPEVVFNRRKRALVFSGVCIPQNPAEFFRPIIDCVQKEFKKKRNSIAIYFQLDYIDSTSMAYLFKIMRILCEIEGNVCIVWYYEKNDPWMYEKGIELRFFTDHKMLFLEKKSDFIKIFKK